MGYLSDLTGVKKQKTECEFFRSVAHAKRLIESGMAATTANTNGALNIWSDDDGILRASAHRNLATIEEQAFASWNQCRKWITKWIVEIA